MLDLIPFGMGPEEQGHLITRLNVPRAHRGMGLSRVLMAEVVRDADRAGQYLWIDASPYPDCPMSKAQLRAYYERLGFSADGSGALRRPPEQAALVPAPA